MKWLKRYSFLLMILVTGIGYGSVKVMKEVESRQAQFLAEQQLSEEEQMTNNGVKLEENHEVKPEENKASGHVTEGQSAVNVGENPQLEQSEAEPTAQQDEPLKKEFRQVEVDYMNDALFIGDSRTSALYEYAGWDQTDFFVKTGLSIWTLWDKRMDGVYLQDKLKEKQYGKIYIMLGVNELEVGTAESFREEFAAALEQIRQLQPNAIIFLEAIIHVSAQKDAEGTYINNQEIDRRNQELYKLTDNETIFWLDANEALDEPQTGAMNGEYTFDGVHLKIKNLDVWQEFLLAHGV